MRPRPWAAYPLMVMALLAGAARVQAQTVLFTDIRDAVPGKFFDAAKSAPSQVNPNRLAIGLDAGIDPATSTATDFKASTQTFGNRNASDTIRFVATAPDGFYITRLTYIQRGTASTLRGSAQSGSTMMEIAGFPFTLGTYSTGVNLQAVADASPLRLTSVPVSVSISLFAAGSGSLAITGVEVGVEVAPLP